MVTLQQMFKNTKTPEINQELASDIAWSQEKFWAQVIEIILSVYISGNIITMY